MLFPAAIIIVGLIAFVVGMNVKNYFISPFNTTSTSDEASDLAKLSTTSGALPKVSNESAPAGTVHSQNGNIYTSQNLPDKVVMNGKYMLSSYKINFTMTLPKNSGDITGSLIGTCEGTITGKAEKPDSDGESTLSGQYSGDCKPIPTLGFKTHASGTFTGTAKFKQNKAEITVSNKEPFETHGSWFELFF